MFYSKLGIFMNENNTGKKYKIMYVLYSYWLNNILIEKHSELARMKLLTHTFNYTNMYTIVGFFLAK